MYAAIGLKFVRWNTEFDDDLNYPGINGLRLLYARAKWKTDGRDESKNLAFDLKYKHSVSEEIDKGATALLAEHGYPSTLTFTQDEYDRYFFKFKGIENIKRNYSRHFQDMFVLSILNGRRDGTFVEIGSGHPELFNNTLLLEKEFGWKGISLDNSERMCSIFSRNRNSTVVLANAANTDYRALFKQNCLEQRIDFLRINAELASIAALKAIPFDKHEFSVLQFQHNAIWWGSEIREESRKLLSKIGYILMVSDVAIDEKSSYEDWWVHPDFAKTKSEMKSSNKINFAWNYMMEKL